MLKFGISLCVLVLASATNPACQPNTLEIARYDVQRVINDTYLELQNKSIATKEEWKKQDLMVHNKADELHKEFMGDVMKVIATVPTMKEEHIADEMGVIVTKCYHNIERYGSRIIGQMGRCIFNKVNSTLTNIRTIITTKFDIAFANLTKIREEVQRCGHNDHSRESRVSAICCVKASRKKARSVRDTLNSVLNSQDIRLNTLLEKSASISTYCRKYDELKDFRRKCASLRESEKNCIKRAIYIASRRGK